MEENDISTLNDDYRPIKFKNVRIFLSAIVIFYVALVGLLVLTIIACLIGRLVDRLIGHLVTSLLSALFKNSSRSSQIETAD